MLRNRGVTGGASMFSDGLRAAYALKEIDREAFDTLCAEPVAFHYINDGHRLYQEHLQSSLPVQVRAHMTAKRPARCAIHKLFTPFQARFHLRRHEIRDSSQR